MDRFLTKAENDSARLNKKDWVLVGMGAATALIVAGAVPPLFLLHLGARAVHLLGHLFEP